MEDRSHLGPVITPDARGEAKPSLFSFLCRAWHRCSYEAGYRRAHRDLIGVLADVPEPWFSRIKHERTP